jgi:hypothetical protein
MWQDFLGEVVKLLANWIGLRNTVNITEVPNRNRCVNAAA